ncbi:radical SAM protein [Paenibacillus sp. FSL R7-0331]|uniref:radical SAM protein n=1 Tax=Paenibacillus sp. FSL R7-0331 TaxID=1536773 RepID=UPI0004F816EA|nr:radical SAM protein [Paenibacillus sp. FSL R7-0331]AIQ51300.1 hypothetical protein R70331_07105 [Paenibacillus sp. FSL R7-0331]
MKTCCQGLNHITLMLTHKCNLKCYMCGQVYSNKRSTDHSELALETIKKQIDTHTGIESAYLFGGEPLLYPGFVELLEYLKAKQIKVFTTTNGVYLDKYVDAIVKHDVFDISISIDSHRETDFAQIRGKRIFNRVLKNLDLLFEFCEKNNKKTPLVGINFVVLKENYQCLVEFYEYITERFPQLNRVNFEAPIFVDPSLGVEYSRIMQHEFGVNSGSWEWFSDKIIPFSNDEIDIIYRQVQELRSKDKASFLLPIVNREEFFDFFHSKHQKSTDYCKFPFSSCSVLPNGDVTFCVDFPDYIIGNINDQSISEIWNGTKASLFKDYLRDNNGGNHPVCSRCPRSFNLNNSIV